MKEVKHINLGKRMSLNELVLEMKKSGVFTGGRVAIAVDIIEEMFKDKECKVFFGLAGAMVPAGMKNIVIDLLKSGNVGVFVSTGANLTHDLIEALDFKHYQGNDFVDDKELSEKGIDRIYDVFMKNEVYEGLEDFFRKNIDEFEGKMSAKEFLWKIGSLLERKGSTHFNPENERESILKVCYENKIPIFCPGITDSGIGLMVYGREMEGKKIEIDVFSDLKEIMDISWECKKSGVIYVGGGLPKNYIQQAMQFSPKSASYGVQITMDRVESGGSSGALLKEGISWGKMSKEGKFVDVWCDATIALPLIFGAVKERILFRKNVHEKN